jgi:hypothetical protein
MSGSVVYWMHGKWLQIQKVMWRLEQKSQRLPFWARVRKSATGLSTKTPGVRCISKVLVGSHVEERVSISSTFTSEIENVKMAMSHSAKLAQRYSHGPSGCWHVCVQIRNLSLGSSRVLLRPPEPLSLLLSELSLLSPVGGDIDSQLFQSGALSLPVKRPSLSASAD